MRDAERLARLLAAGELGFTRIPTIEEQRFRDLIRAREDLRADLMRARQRRRSSSGGASCLGAVEGAPAAPLGAERGDRAPLAPRGE